MRLFFGIELPEPLRSEIRRVQSLLCSAEADVRWVDPSGAHLTLKFLGEVEPDRIRSIDEAARTLEPIRESRLSVRGLGTFPRRGPMRIVWAGVEGETRPLQRLYAGLESAMAELGFAPERRPFRPHVTLGRVRGRRGERALRTAIERHRDHEVGRWSLRRFVLFESRRTPDGPRYEVVGRYPSD